MSDFNTGFSGQDTSSRRGIMIVLSSPSGAGKTTLSRMLLAENDDIAMSVSATTRRPRDGEVDGKDYFFVTKAEFERRIAEDEFLEWAKVFDHYYGTPRGPVEDALSNGQDVLFDIDWQGAQQIAQVAADDLVKIFILPPDIRELEARLHRRAKDSKEVIAKRMAKSAAEISHWAEYDYVIVNKDINDAMHRLRTFVTAERLKRRRQLWLNDFAKTLIENSE